MLLVYTKQHLGHTACITTDPFALACACLGHHNMLGLFGTNGPVLYKPHIPLTLQIFVQACSAKKHLRGGHRSLDRAALCNQHAT